MSEALLDLSEFSNVLKYFTQQKWWECTLHSDETHAPVRATWHPRSRPIPATDKAVTHVVHPRGLILLSVAMPPLPHHPAPCMRKKMARGALPLIRLHPPSQLPPGAYSWRRVTAASRASELDSRDSAKVAGHLTQTQGPEQMLRLACSFASHFGLIE